MRGLWRKVTLHGVSRSKGVKRMQGGVWEGRHHWGAGDRNEDGRMVTYKMAGQVNKHIKDNR